MSKNLTDDQKIENERLARKLSEYINELEFRPENSELAKILNISENELQIDNGIKFSPEQVANLSGEQWSKIRDLDLGWEEGVFDASFDGEKNVMNKIIQFENQSQEEAKQAGINPEQEQSQQPNSQQQDEPEAGDTLFHGTSSVVKENFIDPSIAASSGINATNLDPITEAIRREILAKQRALIVDYLKQNDSGINEDIKDAKKYSEFAKDEENQKKILEALKNQQLKKALEGVEIAGYKKVHEDFERSFSPVKWDGGARIGPEKEGITTSRTQVITRSDGKTEIARLTESTHQIIPNVIVRDSSGKEIELKNYRKIDFPTELESKDGPMHLSMAVKDQHGKNIALSKAVYFTAHYDDSGKLTEVSSPKPVMFSSADPDAIGYIEHQGQIYTLPVTRENYEEMMRALGREEEIGLSKLIGSPELAKDIIMMKTGHTKDEPKISQEESKEKQKSHIEQQVDLEFQKLKQYSVDEFKNSNDKEKFLQDLLESNLSISDKTKYLSEIAKNGHAKEVMRALASSKLDQNDKNDIAGSLLRDASDLDRIKMIEELGKSDNGRKLIINAFEKGDSKERYDISNAIAESSVKDKTALTKEVILVIARPGQESTFNNLNKVDEKLAQNIEKTSSDPSIESAARTVEVKPEESKKEQEEKKKEQLSPEVEERVDIKVNNLRNSLTNPPPVDVPVKKSDKEISEMVKSFSETLDGKDFVEQKNIINTRLDELSKGNVLSNADKKRFLEKLLEDRSDKRGERIDQIQKGNIKKDKDDKSVDVRTSERLTDKEGFSTPIVGQFKSNPELVGRVGGVALQAYIKGKIHDLTPPKPSQAKPKDGYTLGGMGPKY
ncbi:MAG: Sca4 family protein [Rickettsia endosymbiont of Bryobia graminum]|nr:Sca4 family protein [Rickettsia endosymbiont of Bryobia graminum]